MLLGCLGLAYGPCRPAWGDDANKPPSAMIDAIANSLTQKQRDQLLELLGFGTPKQLMTLPGIGEGKAHEIIKARPFFKLTDVTRVPGIGEGLFARMVEHAKKGRLPGRQAK